MGALLDLTLPRRTLPSGRARIETVIVTYPAVSRRLCPDSAASFPWSPLERPSPASDMPVFPHVLNLCRMPPQWMTRQIRWRAQGQVASQTGRSRMFPCLDSQVMEVECI